MEKVAVVDIISLLCHSLCLLFTSASAPVPFAKFYWTCSRLEVVILARVVWQDAALSKQQFVYPSTWVFQFKPGGQDFSPISSFTWDEFVFQAKRDRVLKLCKQCWCFYLESVKCDSDTLDYYVYYTGWLGKKLKNIEYSISKAAVGHSVER